MKTCIFLFHALHTEVLYHFFLFDDSGIQTEVQYSALPRGIPCHLFNNGVTDKRSIFILRTKSKLKKISLSYVSRSCTSTFISLFPDYIFCKHRYHFLCSPMLYTITYVEKG